MKEILPWFQIIVSILLIACILLQRSGAESGGALGGGEGGSFYHLKRGMEKYLFYLTIFFAFAFVSLALISFLLR